MQRLLLVLFIVIILGVLIYALHSAIIPRSSEFFSSLSGDLKFSSSGPTFSNPKLASGGGEDYYASASSGNGISPTAPQNIPPGFTASQLSPYFGEIEIEGVSPSSAYSYGEISLYANVSASSTIDITGWELKSRDSGEYIPRAVDIYDPSGLTPATDIQFQGGQTVYLYSSPGPFNLRLNECIGYIANENKFNPPLPVDCPYVNRGQIQNLTGECQNYIQSLSSCEVPSINNAPISHTDYSCIDYLQNISYKTCFDGHISDLNFLSNQWWVWTGSNIADPYHDQILLLDRNGLLVDEYSY